MVISHYLKYIENVEFINHNKQKIYLHDILTNNIVIISMFYANCKGKCIPLGKHMYKLIKFIGEEIITKKNIHLLHISLDPANDTVEDLNNFKKNILENGNIDNINWNFVTGNPEKLEKLRFNLGMYDPDKNTDKIKEQHSGMSLVINEKFNKNVMLRAYENTMNQARKIFSICIPEIYKKNGYELFKQINYQGFSDDFKDKLFNDIHSIDQVRTLPYLPEEYKEIFKKKAIIEEKKYFEYDPYEEYGKQYKLNKCCNCKKKNNCT